MLRAELIKLTTIRGAYIAAAVAVVGVALTQLTIGWMLPSLASLDPELEATVDGFAASTPALQLASLNLLGGASGGTSLGIALIAVLLLGATVATADARHGGLVTTALAVPRRGRIVASKALAAAVVTGITAVAATIVQFVLVAVSPDVLAAGGYGADALATVDVLARGAITLTLLGVIGAAVGVIVGGQTATYLILIAAAAADPVIRAIFSLVPGAGAWTSYLPIGLAASAAGPNGATAVAPALALGILATLAVAASVAAWAVLRRRDL